MFIRAKETPVIHHRPPEPAPIPPQTVNQFLLILIQSFITCRMLRVAGCRCQLLHTQQHRPELHRSPDALPFALAAYTEKLVVPVRTQH
ncbi:hypothetical protein D3C75_1064240 [compost metagenome]